MNLKEFMDKLEALHFTEYPTKYNVIMLTAVREHNLRGVVLDNKDKKLILYVD